MCSMRHIPMSMCTFLALAFWLFYSADDKQHFTAFSVTFNHWLNYKKRLLQLSIIHHVYEGFRTSKKAGRVRYLLNLYLQICLYLQISCHPANCATDLWNVCCLLTSVCFLTCFCTKTYSSWQPGYLDILFRSRTSEPF